MAVQGMARPPGRQGNTGGLTHRRTPARLGFVKICSTSMDNLAEHSHAPVRLLLAFLAFGAACSTLWAWMLAQSGTIGASTRR